jgi:sterol desaturase/sphingolipid hydroxylase (fatty acid hydroxylase superfamily)
MLDWLNHLIGWVQQTLHESLVQPLLFALGLAQFSEKAFDALEWVVIGAIEIALLALVLGWAERRWPAEPTAGRTEWRVDLLYTALKRLGVLPLLIFALLTPAVDLIEAQLRLMGLSRWQIDQVWPGVTDLPWVSFLMYLVILDFVDYWLHRFQHRWSWWWALHALHHSQRQMTFWADDRNHLLDDLIRDGVIALVALAIGVPPAHFIGLVILSRLLQSLQHANLRWRFGAVGERLLVSPSFHRLHHAVDYGHDGPARGCNFAVLFPVWDWLHRTADPRPGFVPTGIRDQVEGRDYGSGWWSQQWLAMLRMFGRA